MPRTENPDEKKTLTLAGSGTLGQDAGEHTCWVRLLFCSPERGGGFGFDEAW